MSVHKGHRDRMRRRYQEEGLDQFSEHEVLELLLYYAIAQKDTNEVAHNLIAEFGDISAVLSAVPAELTKVPGVGAGTALFLNLINDAHRYVQIRQQEASCKILKTLEDCGKYLFPKFMSCRNEVVYLVCLDIKGKLLGCKLLSEGDMNCAAVPMRKIVEYAINTNATAVVLAHNHPCGVAMPSDDDIQTTRALSLALRMVDVALVDHIVFSDDDFISMCQSGYFANEGIFAGY